MQLSQSKTTEILCTAIILVVLITAAFHIKDIILPKYQKTGRDDYHGARKVVSDWHNHVDKFSFKSLHITGSDMFSSDSRSLKKQLVGHKRLQKMLN